MDLNRALKIKVWLLTILHLLVDGLCAYTVFNRLYLTESNISIIDTFVGYNTLAFLLQPLFGYWFDKIEKEKITLTISLICILIGAIFSLPKYISLFLIGVGNSVFHVIGGKYSIKVSSNKLTYLGLFVSLGACGLALGTYLYQKITLIIFTILTIILGVFCHLIKDEKTIQKDVPPLKLKGKKDILLLILILVAVMIRAIIGKVTAPLFEASILDLIIIALFASLGKALGGIVADLIGIKKTIFVTLTLSLIGYFFFRNYIVVYLLATLLFNTTMPLTLFLSNRLLKHYEGFSFGLLASVLFIGYLLGELYIYLNFSYTPILCVSIVATIYIILYVKKKVAKEL